MGPTSAPVLGAVQLPLALDRPLRILIAVKCKARGTDLACVVSGDINDQSYAVEQQSSPAASDVHQIVHWHTSIAGALAASVVQVVNLSPVTFSGAMPV